MFMASRQKPGGLPHAQGPRPDKQAQGAEGALYRGVTLRHMAEGSAQARVQRDRVQVGF